jgi:hypothetical protein
MDDSHPRNYWAAAEASNEPVPVIIYCSSDSSPTRPLAINNYYPGYTHHKTYDLSCGTCEFATLVISRKDVSVRLNITGGRTAFEGPFGGCYMSILPVGRWCELGGMHWLVAVPKTKVKNLCKLGVRSFNRYQRRLAEQELLGE